MKNWRIKNIISDPSWRKKSDASRRKSGSARRLKSKYRWLENYEVENLIKKVSSSNVSSVAKLIGCPHYVLRGHLERHGYKQGEWKFGKPSWNHGETKELNKVVATAAERLSATRKKMFAVGELKRPDFFMGKEKIDARQKKSCETRIEKYGSPFKIQCWNKGLTKAMSPTIKSMAAHTSATRKKKIASGEIDMWKPIRASREKYVTSIEKILEAELKNRSLLVKPQELLFGKFLVDFLVNDKIVIFADGCYFHGCEIHHKDEFVGLPKRKAIDKSQTSYLEKCGFKVFRFWEHDINKNASKCVDQVVKYIESQPRELAGISN